MPVLQLDDQQFPLKAGVTRIGAGADADVVVPGYSAIGVEAIIDGGATPTIRRATEDSHVTVNGVLLGAEPTPLVHGDKVEVAGLELRYADDAKGGATQFVSASDIAALAGAKRSGAARATTASGGRIVSLVDGKEYSVPAGGIVFGRDASCDVVVPQAEVSRRHAEIVPAENGYVVKDMSANGIFVNGDRVQGSHLLARADVLRIGNEEFRFYADVIPTAKAMPTPASVPVVPETAAPVPAAPPVAEPPVLAEASASKADMPESLDSFGELDLLTPADNPIVPPPAAPVVTPAADVPAPVAQPVKQTPASPAAPTAPSPKREDPRPVLAVLESTNEGPTKGTKHELRTPLAHVGRGGHNDVELNDESVSDSHAKLQRRDDGWYVVDMESTNGTYVGGTRISGERRLDGSPDIRFGSLKFRFSAVGAAAADAKGTRAIAAMRPSSVGAPAQATGKTPAGQPTAKSPAATPAASTPAPEKSGGIPSIVWVVIGVAVVAAVAFFLLKR
jgi:pSer/pThr/pTyr-binding forkhead associated (FHA) protein